MLFEKSFFLCVIVLVACLLTVPQCVPHVLSILLYLYFCIIFIYLFCWASFSCNGVINCILCFDECSDL